MKATTRVELHCHSLLSDGALPPAAIAEALAGAGVQVASLTDHDTVEGLAEFASVLARRDVAFVPGVELTTQLDGVELHLLGYGFDATHPELLERLRTVRGAKPRDVQNVQDTMRNATSGAALRTEDAIELIHRAGGKAFLAHPLHVTSDLPSLESVVERLKQAGLDGIEALYAGFSSQEQEGLVELASRQGLLVSAGTDLHAHRAGDPQPKGVEMPMELWKAFRDAVCLAGAKPPPRPEPSRRSRARPHWRSFGLHIVMPSALALALFIAAIFLVFVPRFEDSLLDRKREMIRELTNSAWSILDGFHRDAQRGQMTKAEAQRLAIARIESLRYGRESKDYFWIQSTEPRMLMHPYRPDLNGKDVSDFRDARGVRIFTEFANMARRGQEGYVDYVWQWKDDPNRLEPKESFIRPFAPWGWVIGTGIYVEDVREEIREIERDLVAGAVGITFIVALLLLYAVRQSMTLERERADAEEGLLESRERYRSLVEATTEGTLLITEGRCSYANPTFLGMAGASQEEVGLLDLEDWFPKDAGNLAAWPHLERVLQGQEESEGFDAVLRRRDGTLLDCVVSASRITFGGRSGQILIVREVTASGDSGWNGIGGMADQLAVGLFRARATSRGPLIQVNDLARRLLFPGRGPDGSLGALADAAPGVYESLFEELLNRGVSSRRTSLGNVQIEIQAALERDDHGVPRHVDGIVRDITDEESRREGLAHELGRLQRSLLFLHEPIGLHVEPAVCVPLDSECVAVAAAMTQRRSSLAVVLSPAGEPIGVVTDEDLRSRVLTSRISPTVSVASIMTAPVVSVRDSAPVFEALLTMERRGLHHLLVVRSNGDLAGVVRSSELTPFREYGPLVLARDLSMANSADAMAEHAARIPALAQALLEGGASPGQVSELLTSACDAATRRLIQLAIESLGEPPCAFAWMALGSQGRQEMVLTSDQDNAIVFADGVAGAEEYFLELAERVNAGLERCGYGACRGGVMARNPRWTLPLSAWRQNFTEWIALPEPQPLLEFTIFFDLRTAFGEDRLVQSLREHISLETHARPAFYPLLAQSALQFRPPTRLFGRMLGGENPGRLDLKEALMPISGFARLYALREHVSVTGTHSRLKELAAREVLRAQGAQDAIAAFDALHGIRLRLQLAAATSGRSPENEVTLSDLDSEAQARLHSALSEVETLQKRIAYDFFGGATL